MVKSVKLRLAIGTSVSLMLLMSAVATVLAGWVNLTHGHACGPTQGNFTWSQTNNTNDVTWYQYAKWSGSQYTCIQGAGDWYQLEAEAYNPAGGGTSCDKLHTYSTSYTLPLRSSPSVANGCGSTTYKEETKFPIKSSSIGNNVEYWTPAYELPRDASADLSMTRREFVAMAHPAMAGWETRKELQIQRR
jgi:hypothetical protein